MLRKITVEAIGRYEQGGTHDYPKGVWEKIAKDLAKDPKNKEVFAGVKDKDDGMALLRCFSESVDINQTHQSATRGPIKLRQRTGSPPRVPLRGA